MYDSYLLFPNSGQVRSFFCLLIILVRNRFSVRLNSISKRKKKEKATSKYNIKTEIIIIGKEKKTQKKNSKSCWDLSLPEPPQQQHWCPVSVTIRVFLIQWICLKKRNGAGKSNELIWMNEARYYSRFRLIIVCVCVCLRAYFRLILMILPPCPISTALV